MRLFFIYTFFLLFTCFVPAQQLYEAKPVTASVAQAQNGATLALIIPDSFCMNRDGAFLLWTGRPESFVFFLYNRTGTIIAASDQFDFNLDVAIGNNKNQVMMGKEEVYVYKLAYTESNGSRKTLAGHIISTGQTCKRK